MKKFLLLMLAATALFWRLGQQTNNVVPLPGTNTTVMPAIALAIVEPGIADADIHHYDISGDNLAALRADMNRQQPAPGFDGHTAWQVNWRWPGYASTECDLAAATLDTRITVSLPRWRPPHDADPALILHWNHYIGSLTRHEQGHVQLAREGFAKMQTILHDSTCTDADARLNTVLAEMRQADLRYDADTRHGVTQGARFP